MRVVVRRRITPEELQRELTSYTGLVSPVDLERAVMEYEEDGETTLTVEEEVPVNVLRRLVSPRMLQVLEVLRKGGSACISEIARALGRSVPNVYSDVKFLEKHGFVYISRRGRLAVPVLLLEEVRLEI